jgi:hypothetical protein
MAINQWLGACAVVALALHTYAANAQRNDDDDDDERVNLPCSTELGAVLVEANLQITGKCTLAGTEVDGNVTLFSGGSLTARAARIGGNLEATAENRADFVDIDSSRIEGNLRLEELVGDNSSISATEVRRDVVLMGNQSYFEILNNEFNGDFSLLWNSGGLLVSGNDIDDDVTCVLNSPAPTGVGNRIDDRSAGQCGNMESGPAPPPEPPPPAPPPPAPSPTPDPAPTPPPPAPAPAPTPAPAPAPAPAAPPAAAAPPTPELAPDEGGAGATGWPIALLLPLLAWRRGRERRTR